MIPRSRVDAIASEELVSAVLQRMSTGHTRYPVIDTASDDIIGVIHLHDLLGPVPAADTAGMHCRPPVVVPETLPLPNVVRELEKGGEEMAVVIDEYGGFAGIVTIEDLAEELVGEIDDEHDTEGDADIVADGDGWLLAGDLPLDEAERTLDLLLPQGDYETIAGMVVAHADGLPEVGDSIVIDLPLNPADLIDDGDPPARRLTAEIRSIERRVPATIFATTEISHGDAR